jgi:hypothetical protein
MERPMAVRRFELLRKKVYQNEKRRVARRVSGYEGLMARTIAGYREHLLRQTVS